MDPKIWSDMFIIGVPILEKILRPVIIYIFLVLGLRLAGKRELAQLNPFDLVVLLTLSNTVQNAIIGDDTSVTGGLVGAATLILVNYLVVRFLFRHPKLDTLVEGDREILIENGKLRMENLQRELITIPELETAAHKQGFDSLEDVEKAVIEPGGSITFIRRESRPEELRHQELVARLDQLSRELASLRGGIQ